MLKELHSFLKIKALFFHFLLRFLPYETIFRPPSLL
jgi:hypothetical protein